MDSYERFLQDDEETFDDQEKDKLYLSMEDIGFISDFIVRDRDKYDVELFRLLVSFAAYARANPHPKQWIKCDAKDKNSIFYLASCGNLPAKDKEILTNTLHLVYNMNMRVVGSNQPTPCFKFDWQANQSPIEEEDNCLVEIGKACPSTIVDFVAQFYLKNTVIKVEEL